MQQLQIRFAILLIYLPLAFYQPGFAAITKWRNIMTNLLSLNQTEHINDSLSQQIELLCQKTPLAYDVLKQLEDYHQYFLANASHELQTLLCLMSSCIQAIEASHPEVRCYRYWAELSSDCRLMTHLLRDLTDYSMSTQLNRKRSDMCALLRQAYLSCLPLTEGTLKTLTYTSNLSCAYVFLDSQKMMEALLNLIVNALDAIQNDGHVHILLSKANEQLSVSISDDGCGIPAQKLLTIFHPFVTTKEDGTGLGLPVAKRIIEGHGGHIRVSSAPQQGATFTFRLPFATS